MKPIFSRARLPFFITLNLVIAVGIYFAFRQPIFNLVAQSPAKLLRPDMFLDATVPELPRTVSWLDCLHQMEQVTGKHLVTPPDMMRFLSIHPPRWMSLSKSGGGTMREYLDRNARCMGMRWNYDAKKDAIVLDFDWRREDSRSDAEIMQQIVSDDRTTRESAFNVLLSKPENYADGWKVRVIGNGANGMGFPMTARLYNLYSGLLTDESGRPFLLVVNLHEPMMIPGVYYVSYYLFDEKGKFQDGGVYDAGTSWGGGGKLRWDEETKRMVHTIGGYELDFAVENSRFVLKRALENGSAYNPQLAKYNSAGKFSFVESAD